MSIKNIRVKNSRVGIHSLEHHEVKQLVTIIIEYKEIEKKKKEISLGLRKRTTLSFYTNSYFGTITNKMLELWEEDGVLLNTIPMPKGEFIDIYNDWFIFLYKKTVNAYDKSGIKVAEGEISDKKEIVLHPLGTNSIKNT